MLFSLPALLEGSLFGWLVFCPPHSYFLLNYHNNFYALILLIKNSTVISISFLAQLKLIFQFDFHLYRDTFLIVIPAKYEEVLLWFSF